MCKGTLIFAHTQEMREMNDEKLSKIYDFVVGIFLSRIVEMVFR